MTRPASKEQTEMHVNATGGWCQCVWKHGTTEYRSATGQDERPVVGRRCKRCGRPVEVNGVRRPQDR